MLWREDFTPFGESRQNPAANDNKEHFTGHIADAHSGIENDAWDLPVSATMEPFLERHPDWTDYATIEGAFEWKWYYAFQQVGDQTAEELSLAYRAGRDRRDRVSSILSWLTPPAKLERIFQSLADTDVQATREYEDRVRAFHADLRSYYYPNLFMDLPFTDEALAERPGYSATPQAE